MSNLRIQLDRAKAEYHSAEYPGDLATELLTMRIPSGASAVSVGARVTRNRWFWAAGTSSAAAAALVGAFMLSSSTSNMTGDYGIVGGNAGYVFSPTRGSVTTEPATPNPFVLSSTPVPPAGNRFLLDDRGNARSGNPRFGRGIELVESPASRSDYREFDIQPNVRTMEFDVPKR